MLFINGKRKLNFTRKDSCLPVLMCLYQFRHITAEWVTTMKETEMKTVGSRVGMELRDGKTAEVGSTERIKMLNKALHASRPNLELQRTRVFTEYFKTHESQSTLTKRYTALSKVFETLPITIVEGERLLGWQGKKLRASNFAIEAHACWLEEDIPTFETRDFDPWKVTEEEKKELLEIHIPYWREKTIRSRWLGQSEADAMIALASGYTDASNFASNPGSHFSPDMRKLLKIGYKGYAQICKEHLEEMDETLPENVGKREFYQGLIRICESIKKYGQNLHAAAQKEAEKCTNETRRKELLEAGERAEKITWEAPESFVEALHLCWITMVMIYVEASGCSIGLGRFDQYMWPFLKKDLEEGKITIEEAEEWMEEFNIKVTNITWLLPENLAKFFGGFFRWAGQYCVGGIDRNGEDAVNLLSYICLRSLRYTRTTGPAIHAYISEKNPDSYINEAIKLSAEGIGHPSFFSVETIHEMIRHRASGNELESRFTQEEINERACTVGCVEPLMDGEQQGHSNSNLTNLGNTLSVTLNNGVLPRQCPGYGAGTVVGLQTGDPTKFKDFEELYDAVVRQFRNQIDLCHKHLLLLEKIIAEEQQMPICTLLVDGTLDSGKDFQAGGAKFNLGPTYNVSGIADLADSMIAIKKLVFEEKQITMEELLRALDANFEGYEDIRQLCLQAPKYGNDIDEVDELLNRLLCDFSEYVRTKRSWRAEGAHSSLGIQPAQANVGNGALCYALPNGRKAFAPFADALSCEQGKDVNGILATVRSYGKVRHGEVNNGTLLNLWITSSALINEF